MYVSVILKDIIMRNKVASLAILDKIVEYVVGNTTLILSGKKITNTLNENNIEVSALTVYDY